MKNHDRIVDEQIQYYRERAAEYDEWFNRQGRYNQGEAHTRQWAGEVATVQQALADFNPTGTVLEIASGTGWWTEQLVPYADALTAVDASPETIAINKAKVNSDKVSYIQANIFEWEPQQQYDVVFFSFWLSHVPPDRFESFWELVRRCLKDNGRVFLIDTLYTPQATSTDQSLNEEMDSTVTRILKNGKTFEIVKLFYSPERLNNALEPLGWACHFEQTVSSFVYGRCHPK